MEGATAPIDDAVVIEVTREDILKFSEFLSSTAQLTINARQPDLSTFLSQESPKVVLKQFLGDSESPILVLISQPEGNEAEDGGNIEARINFSISLKLMFMDSSASSLAFIKRTKSLDLTKPFSSQLQILSLGNGSPLEILHSYFHHAVSPYFNSFASKLGDDAARDLKAGVPLVKSKMAELELTLLQLQQNVTIPRVTLYPPKFVEDLLKTYGGKKS
jgi:dynein heavy chain 1